MFYLFNRALLVANIVSVTNVTCNGAANGTATASATGGTAPYSYTFKNAANSIIAGPINNPTVTNLAPGTYSVVITDQNSCSATAFFAITQPSAVQAAIIATTPASCFGGTNGTATASAFGGTPNYGFTWPGNIMGAVRTGLAVTWLGSVAGGVARCG